MRDVGFQKRPAFIGGAERCLDVSTCIVLAYALRQLHNWVIVVVFELGLLASEAPTISVSGPSASHRSGFTILWLLDPGAKCICLKSRWVHDTPLTASGRSSLIAPLCCSHSFPGDLLLAQVYSAPRGRP